MRIGTIGGVVCKVHGSFFIVAALFGCAGLLLETCIVVVSVLLHEFGHVAAARCCGYTVAAVTLLPFGGVAKIERFGDFAPSKICFTAAAGPVVSAVLAGAAFWGAAVNDGAVWKILAQVNAMLAGFNLLPAFPLDGAHLARAFCARASSYPQMTRRLVWISWAIGGVMLLKVVYDAVVWRTMNLSLFFLAFFIFFAARRELSGCSFHRMRVMAYKKADLMRQGCLTLRYYAVRREMPLKAATGLFVPESCTVIAVLGEAHEICGCFTEFQIWEALAARGLTACCGDLLLQRQESKQDFFPKL